MTTAHEIHSKYHGTEHQRLNCQREDSLSAEYHLRKNMVDQSSLFSFVDPDQASRLLPTSIITPGLLLSVTSIGRSRSPLALEDERAIESLAPWNNRYRRWGAGLFLRGHKGFGWWFAQCLGLGANLGALAILLLLKGNLGR